MSGVDAAHPVPNQDLITKIERTRSDSDLLRQGLDVLKKDQTAATDSLKRTAEARAKLAETQKAGTSLSDLSARTSSKFDSLKGQAKTSEHSLKKLEGRTDQTKETLQETIHIRDGINDSVKANAERQQKVEADLKIAESQKDEVQRSSLKLSAEQEKPKERLDAVEAAHQVIKDQAKAVTQDTIEVNSRLEGMQQQKDVIGEQARHVKENQADIRITVKSVEQSEQDMNKEAAKISDHQKQMEVTLEHVKTKKAVIEDNARAIEKDQHEIRLEQDRIRQVAADINEMNPAAKARQMLQRFQGGAEQFAFQLRQYNWSRVLNGFLQIVAKVVGVVWTFLLHVVLPLVQKTQKYLLKHYRKFVPT